MTEAKFPCATCNKEVQIRDHAIQCELCKSWEHIVCIREVDRIPEGLYAMLCEMQCNALWAVCSVCRGKGSPMQKLQEFRPESIMLQNLPIMLFGISLIFCLLCLFLCFLDMNYADNSYI